MRIESTNELLTSVTREIVEEVSESFLQYWTDVQFIDDIAIITGEDGHFMKVRVDRLGTFEVEIYDDPETGSCTGVFTFNEQNRTRAIHLVTKMFVPEEVVYETYPEYLSGLRDSE